MLHCLSGRPNILAISISILNCFIKCNAECSHENNECISERKIQSLGRRYNKDQRISQLGGQMRQMTIKFNELESCESKDCLIFHNLPIGANGSYLADTVAFIREVL